MARRRQLAINQMSGKDGTKMFERIEYTVERLDGDYAYLRNEAAPEEELKCVARALLPPEISEGSRLAYEMFQYSVI